MEEKELFEIALKYMEKSYSIEDLRYGDDLYSATSEEKQKCISYYQDIKKEGLKWAYKHLKTLDLKL